MTLLLPNFVTSFVTIYSILQIPWNKLIPEHIFLTEKGTTLMNLVTQMQGKYNILALQKCYIRTCSDVQ